MLSVCASVMVWSPFKFEVQRCAALLLSARPGVVRARARSGEGDHPACTSRRCGRSRTPRLSAPDLLRGFTLDRARGSAPFRAIARNFHILSRVSR